MPRPDELHLKVLQLRVELETSTLRHFTFADGCV